VERLIWATMLHSRLHRSTTPQVVSEDFMKIRITQQH